MAKFVLCFAFLAICVVAALASDCCGGGDPHCHQCGGCGGCGACGGCNNIQSPCGNKRLGNSQNANPAKAASANAIKNNVDVGQTSNNSNKGNNKCSSNNNNRQKNNQKLNNSNRNKNRGRCAKPCQPKVVVVKPCPPVVKPCPPVVQPCPPVVPPCLPVVPPCPLVKTCN